MAENVGKKFENTIRESFLKPGISVDRLPDQTNGYLGSTNICDFIIYKYPHQYYIECKSIHGNTFPLSNVTKNQRQELLRKSIIAGVFAGVICWWVDHDTTLFIPIQEIELERLDGVKSIRYDVPRVHGIIELKGWKKRKFYDYDVKTFFKEMIAWKNSH